MSTYREDLDLRLARLKEYRDSSVPSLKSDSPAPRRGIGTTHLMESTSSNGSVPSKMDVLWWVRAVLVLTLLVIIARYIFSSLGWYEASMTVAYLGMGAISFGAFISVYGSIKVQLDSRKSGRPKRRRGK